MKRLLVLLAGLVFSGFALAAVNINTATEQELQMLSGIGAAKARAILAYRKAYGPFKSIDQLKNVSGIGDATFEAIKGDVALSGTTVAPPPRGGPEKPHKAAKLEAENAAKAEAAKAAGTTSAKGADSSAPAASGSAPSSTGSSAAAPAKK